VYFEFYIYPLICFWWL